MEEILLTSALFSAFLFNILREFFALCGVRTASGHFSQNNFPEKRMSRHGPQVGHIRRAEQPSTEQKNPRNSKIGEREREIVAIYIYIYMEAKNREENCRKIRFFLSIFANFSSISLDLLFSCSGDGHGLCKSGMHKRLQKVPLQMLPNFQVKQLAAATPESQSQASW